MKIRAFVKKYLPIKTIGGRIYVERRSFEEVLGDPDRDKFTLT
jgi:hypothetical protein